MSQTDIDGLREKLAEKIYHWIYVQAHPEYTATKMSRKAERFADEIMEIVASERQELTKSFGGCLNCYGKGYHTKRVGHSSKLGNTTYDTIGYCSCARGEQLEKIVNSERQAAAIEELEWVLSRKTTTEQAIKRLKELRNK